MKACIRLVGVVVAAAVVIIWSGYAYAGILTINFPDDLADKGDLVNHNSTADGFRISPRWHYSSFVSTSNPPFSVPGIGWDESGPLNPNFLGPNTVFFGCFAPCTVALYVDANGRPFDLFSLEALGFVDYYAHSSKGAVDLMRTGVVSSPPPLHVDFTGPVWRGIEWVEFSGGFFGGLPLHGFNQLVVFVPAPSTLALLGLGVVIIGWRSRFLRPRVK